MWREWKEEVNKQMQQELPEEEIELQTGLSVSSLLLFSPPPQTVSWLPFQLSN